MEAVARPKYCAECGQKVGGDGRFCGGCGKAVLGIEQGAVSSQGVAPPRIVQGVPAGVDPSIVLAGGWLAMASPRLRESKGSGLAIVFAAALACTTLADLVWWFDYVNERTRIDASMLQMISIGSLVAVALGTMANVRLARGAPSEASGGAPKALVAVPLAMALLSLAMVPSVERSIDEARQAKRQALDAPSGIDTEARDRALFGPRPSSRPIAVDPTFPVK